MNNDVVIIELDRPRQLKYTYLALKSLSSMTGKSIEDLDGKLDVVNNFEMLEQLVYCGLLKDARDNNETLTMERIPELLDYAPTFVYVLEKVNAAWRVTFGAPAELPEGNQPPAAEPAKENDSTGKNRSE